MKSYLLVCLECSPAGTRHRQPPIPFMSEEERGRWAAKHTAGTGHDNWWCGER